MAPPTIPLAQRFWSKVEITDSCWLWKASTNQQGYGQLSVVDNRRRRSLRAHRVAYELLVGPIPDGLHLDHLCRNRICVNPEHLEPVTCAENLRRGIEAGVGPGVHWRLKTHCIHGHPFDEVNTRFTHGMRQCRTCGRERKRLKRAAA